MTRWVVDASVAVKCLIREVHTDEARRLLSTATEVIAPDLLWPEVGSAVWKRLRRGELSQDEAAYLVDGLDRLRIVAYSGAPIMRPALRIAVHHDRSFYDSLYLALAAEVGYPLVTADRKFHEAIKRGPLAGHILWIEDAASA